MSSNLNAHFHPDPNSNENAAVERTVEASSPEAVEVGNSEVANNKQESQKISVWVYMDFAFWALALILAGVATFTSGNFSVLFLVLLAGSWNVTRVVSLLWAGDEYVAEANLESKWAFVSCLGCVVAVLLGFTVIQLLAGASMSIGPSIVLIGGVLLVSWLACAGDRIKERLIIQGIGSALIIIVAAVIGVF